MMKTSAGQCKTAGHKVLPYPNKKAHGPKPVG